MLDAKQPFCSSSQKTATQKQITMTFGTKAMQRYTYTWNEVLTLNNSARI